MTSSDIAVKRTFKEVEAESRGTTKRIRLSVDSTYSEQCEASLETCNQTDSKEPSIQAYSEDSALSQPGENQPRTEMSVTGEKDAAESTKTVYEKYPEKDDEKGDEEGDEKGDQEGDEKSDEEGDEKGDEEGDEKGDEEGDEKGDQEGDQEGDEKADERDAGAGDLRDGETASEGGGAVSEIETDSARLEKIRYQIEYYFSETNLRRDKFFRNKIQYDSQNGLNFYLLRKCNKLKALKVSESDIISSLKDSKFLKTIKNDKGIWKVIRSTKFELPTENNSREEKVEISIEDHTQYAKFGNFLRVEFPPQRESWAILRSKLEARIKELLGDKKKKIFLEFTIDSHNEYTPQVTNVYCQRFIGDNEVLAGLESIEFNDQKVGVSLITELADKEKICKNMGFKHRKIMQKHHQAFMALVSTQPLVLGGVRFDNLKCFKVYYRNLLDNTVPGSDISEDSFKVIKAALEYHPNATRKARDIKSLKVDFARSLPKVAGTLKQDLPRVKCFFVVRRDGTSEDFSIVKCIESMKNNMPLSVFNDSAKKSSADSKNQPVTERTIDSLKNCEE